MAFRDGPFENIKVPLVWTAAVATLAAGAGAIVLLISDARASDSPYQSTRAGVDSVTGPVNGVFAAPVRWFGGAGDYVGSYFFAISENRRLKRELAEARVWRDQAIAMKNINARYEAMLGLTSDPPVPMQTARSVADARGPFSNARLLDAGAAKGIRVGNPVVNEHGLVGRIVGASPAYSRMLLLTDVASRTPILIDRTDARAILTGDGSDNPRLEFLRQQNVIQPGDRILSSGDGGSLPRGLPIGVAAKGIDGQWRVKLYSDRGAVDYVRVLLFQSFAQLVDPNTLNAAPLAGLGSAPEPSPEQAASIADAAARRQAAREAAAERARVADAAAATAAAQPQVTPAPAGAPPVAPP